MSVLWQHKNFHPFIILLNPTTEIRYCQTCLGNWGISGISKAFSEIPGICRKIWIFCHLFDTVWILGKCTTLRKTNFKAKFGLHNLILIIPINRASFLYAVSGFSPPNPQPYLYEPRRSFPNCRTGKLELCCSWNPRKRKSRASSIQLLLTL